jgi:hypothetical protein
VRGRHRHPRRNWLAPFEVIVAVYRAWPRDPRASDARIAMDFVEMMYEDEDQDEVLLKERYDDV